MDDYAGRVLAGRYRLPLPSDDAYEQAETRAFDTYSGQEVLVRQVPLPEVVEAEVLDDDSYGTPDAHMSGGASGYGGAPGYGRTTRQPAEPAVRRAVEAAQAAAQIPDHPRLDQVFDVFAEDGSLWIVSELVAARPLSALLAERPMNPFRAAEVAADVLTALRVLHAHGWTHRNITARTVLICDDGRVVLTGLAVGVAQEALCGYVGVPLPPEGDGFGESPPPATAPAPPTPPAPSADHGLNEPTPYVDSERDPERQQEQGPRPAPPGAGARAGVVAAYRAGAGAAARTGAEGQLPDRRGAVPDGASAAAPEPGGRSDLGSSRDQGVYDPVRGVRVPSGASASPYAEDEGPDSGRTRRQYDPVTGRWVPRPIPRQTDTDAAHAPTGSGAGSPELPPAGAGSAPGTVALPSSGAGPAPWPFAPPSGAGHAPTGSGAGSPELPPAGAGSAPGTAALPPAGAGPAPWPFAPPSGAGHAPTGSEAGRPELPSAGAGPAPRTPELPPAGAEPAPRRSALPSAGAGPAPRTPALPPGFRADAFRADSQRRPHPSTPTASPAEERRGARGWARSPEQGPAPERGSRSQPPGPGSGHAAEPAAAPYRGPDTRLAAERARHTRMVVVGAVTERWAPEQAGPIHENWRLAPPIGPATDLWALGALLFRAVQGHAPYPEESAADLVQMVCGEPPAFAEECGPLRPVVESLLRQDPTERPEFEELRGWLRSLVRSAPEPDAGTRIAPPVVPDARRLPVLRRRGELVRRRRRTAAAPVEHGRHRQSRPAPRRARPRSLGRLLLVLILVLLAAAVAYAVLFMPKSGSAQNTGSAIPPHTGAQSSPPEESGGASRAPAPGGTPPSQQTQTTGPGGPSPTPATGYAVRKDAEGFQVGVDRTWQRQPLNDAGQVRYVGGDFTLIVVPGRDSVQENGSDPLVYQASKERELQPFRDSSWATSTGLRRIDVGQQSMAEGQFTWRDSSGRQVYVRNLAMIINGRYHVVQVIGPEEQRDKVTEIFGQATGAYRATR
ncbi:protein kinase [Streptomyces sp. NPDC056682]|uniref:protein kinase n=1 Tax=Streptomyces sp. NPDC056682 TaxID=3345909 RepID=UPI0036964EF2